MKRPFLFLVNLISLFILSIPVYSQKNTWKVVETENKVSGRSECSMVSLNNKLYLLGGDGPAMNVEELDLKTLLWSKKSLAPVPLHHFQAVGYNNKIYVLDAFFKGNFPNQEPAAHIYAYNVITDKWSILKGLPPERRRAGSGAALYHGNLYLVGGIQHGHSSGTNNFFDEFDPKTDTWTVLPNAPHIRDHAMAVVVRDKLYAVGGRNTSFKDPKNQMSFFSQVVLDVDCFDFKTQKWTTLAAKLPQGTGGGTAVVIHGIIYYIGGERATETLPNGPQRDVYFLDPERSNTWRKGPPLNYARNGAGGTVLGNNIYIAGGVEGPHGLGGPGGAGRPIGSMPMRHPIPGIHLQAPDSNSHSKNKGLNPDQGGSENDPGIVVETLEVK